MTEESRLEPDGTLLTLLDEQGNERTFEHLASLEWQGGRYLALSPCYDDPKELVDSDGELVILKSVEENGEELLASVEDEDEFGTVSEKFERLLGDRYEIEQDDDAAGGDVPREGGAPRTGGAPPRR